MVTSQYKFQLGFPYHSKILIKISLCSLNVHYMPDIMSFIYDLWLMYKTEKTNTPDTFLASVICQGSSHCFHDVSGHLRLPHLLQISVQTSTFISLSISHSVKNWNLTFLPTSTTPNSPQLVLIFFPFH